MASRYDSERKKMGITTSSSSSSRYAAERQAIFHPPSSTADWRKQEDTNVMPDIPTEPIKQPSIWDKIKVGDIKGLTGGSSDSNTTQNSSMADFRRIESSPSSVPESKSSTWDQIKAGDIKGLGTKLGVGLAHGLSQTGTSKMDRYMAEKNADKEGPLQSFYQNQLANQQRQEEYLKANPADSFPAMLGEQIPQIPLWMAGEGAVKLAGKGIAKLSPRLASTAEKYGSRIPSFVKGGLTDAATYGTVVAPTENIRQGGSLQELLDKEKQLPMIALGGVATRGLFSGIGKGVNAGKDALKPLGVPAEPFGPPRPTYSIPRRSGLGELNSNDVIPLSERAALSNALKKTKLQSNPLEDVQSAYSSPLLQDIKLANPRTVQRGAELGPLSIVDPATLPYKSRQALSHENKQAELTDTFLSKPLVDTPMTTRTLQDGIDSSLGIGKPSPTDYNAPEIFGKPLQTLKKSTDTQDTISELTKIMTKQANDVTKTLRQMDKETPIETTRLKIKNMGGIKPNKRDLFEEQQSIPSWIKNANGRPLDEVADTLGMTSEELRLLISSEEFKPKDYISETFKVLRNDPEYQANIKLLETLKSQLPGKRTLNTNADKDVVYHGTNKDFKEFDAKQNLRTTLRGPAFYFTDSLKSAEEYASSYKHGGTPRVIKAKLKHDKLWDYNKDKITPEDYEWIYNHEGELPNISEPTLLGQLKGVNDFSYGLKKLGYDGLKITEKDGSNTYAVFNPEQITQLPKLITKADIKLKPRELTPKPEPLPIQPPGRITLSGNLPVDSPIKPIKHLTPIERKPLQWTNRDGIPVSQKPIRPIPTEQTLADVLKGREANAPLKSPEVEMPKVGSSVASDPIKISMESNGKTMVNGKLVDAGSSKNFDYMDGQIHIAGGLNSDGSLYIGTTDKLLSAEKGLMGKAIDKVVGRYRGEGDTISVITADGSDSFLKSAQKYYGIENVKVIESNVYGGHNQHTVKINVAKPSQKPLPQIPVTEPSGVERLSLPDTLANNPNTSKEFSNRLKQTGYDYGTIHNKDTLALAENYVRENHDDALAIVLSDVENTAEKNTVAKLLIDEAEASKNWELASEIVSKISNNAKTQGQANQALAMWGKLEPATIIKTAEKTINKARTLKQVSDIERTTKDLTSAMNKANSEVVETVIKDVESGKGPKLSAKPVRQVKTAPKLTDELITKLDAIEVAARERLASRKGNLNSLPIDLLADYAVIGTTKIAKGAIKFSVWSADMLKEFGDDIKPHLSKIWDMSHMRYSEFAEANGLNAIGKELTPEEILSNRIKVSLSEKGSPKEKDAVKMMINTLHKVAKESPLPNGEKIPSNPLEFVADAIRNRSEYKDVWYKAKEIIEKEYADNPEVLALLDDYLAKGIDPTFAEGQLNSAVSKGLKEMNVSIRDIVTQHYTVGNKIREDLVTQLVEKAGLSGEDAAILEKHVVARIAELTKTKKEQILAQMFKPKIARNRKELSQKIIELSNVGGFHDQKFKMLVGEKLGIPTLDEATIKSISERSNAIQAMPEGEAKKQAVQAMLQMIANKVPSTMAEKILGTARIAMLGNAKTMSINTVSNAVFGAVDNLSNVVATPLDKALGKFSIGGIAKKRTTTIPSVRGQLKSTVSGIKDVVHDFSGGLKASDLEGKLFGEKIKLIRDSTRDPLNGLEGVSQYDLPNKKIFQGRDIVSRTLNRADNLVKTGLTGGDHPFYKAAKEESLRQQMKLAGVTEPTEEMMNQAVKTANERTYRDVNTLSGAFKSIQEGFNSAGAYFGFGTKDIGAGNIAMPFIKTPANLMARAIDYSPLGFNRAVKELLHIKKGTFDQKAFVDSVSRGVTGTALIMVGYDLAEKGIITGRGNKDKDIATFERGLGKNDYAYKVGDTYHTYDWMQPGSIAIAIGADVFLNGKDRKDAQNVIMDGIVSGGGTLFKQSVVQGLSRFAGGYTPVESIATSIKNAPTMFIPALLKQSAQKSDPITRSTYDPSEDKTILNTMKNKIPGLSKGLEPQVDTFGNIKKNFQGDNSVLNSFFKIGKSTEFKPDAVQQGILNVYKATGDNAVFPKVAPKSLTEKGETITLTPREMALFQQTMGTNTMKKLAPIVNKGGSDKGKATLIKAAIDSSYEKAKKELLAGRK